MSEINKIMDELRNAIEENKEDNTMENTYAERIMNADNFYSFDPEARERMHDEFAYVLDNWGNWRYDSYVLYDILDKWFKRKRELIALLSKHPNFDEKNFCITLDDTTYTREINSNKCGDMWRWLDDKLNEILIPLKQKHGITDNYWFTTGYEEYKEAMAIATKEVNDKIIALEFLKQLVSNYTQTITDEDFTGICRGYQDNHDELPYIFMKDRFNVSMQIGQKRSRVVRNIASKIGLLEDPEWNQMYAQYCDAVNPLKIKSPTVISANFIDFILQSNGDSWSSCHNIDKETYSGCNCSGSMSYALDTTSLQMHTYLPEYIEKANKRGWGVGKDMKFAGKHKRVIIHMGHDFNYFVFSCVYPERTVEQREKLLPVFEKVLAECLYKPNLWVSQNANMLVRGSSDCTAYPDWNQSYCLAKTVRIKGYDESAMETIYTGAAPVCIECGGEHCNESTISCCQGRYTCTHCGNEVDSEDELFWSEINQQYVCEECALYCAYEDDWEYNDYVTWVSSVDSYVSQSTLESDFYYCKDCGEYYLEGEVYEKVSGGYVCHGCATNRYFICDGCGKAIDYDWDEYLETEEGYIYCEECAVDHQDELNEEEDEDVA